MMKLFMPVETLAGMWVWPGQVPAAFLRTMGAIDLAGGLGVLLPALTRIKPGLGRARRARLRGAPGRGNDLSRLAR
jgi:hypothetical protein